MDYPAQPEPNGDTRGLHLTTIVGDCIGWQMDGKLQLPVLRLRAHPESIHDIIDLATIKGRKFVVSFYLPPERKSAKMKETVAEGRARVADTQWKRIKATHFEPA